MNPTRRSLVSLVAGAMLAAGFAPATAAPTKWDLSIAWPAGNFHTINVITFADEIRKRTGGQVDVTVHPGGALGLKGPESLRAVRDGIVPIAEMNLSQQSGDMPLLSLETLPFLIRSQGELGEYYAVARPEIERQLARFKQKLLYIVPWPSQFLFTKGPVAKYDDLKGIKIRTTDRNNAETMERMGMSSVTMPYSDLIPAVGTGAVNAVQTSAPTAVDFKFWEFLGHGVHTNHTWSSNMVTVNIDKWNALPAEHRATIEAVAKELEPKFWKGSAQADIDAQKVIAEKGMKLVEPAAEMRASMESATRPIWDAFVTRVPQAKPILDQYLAGRKSRTSGSR